MSVHRVNVSQKEIFSQQCAHVYVQSLVPVCVLFTLIRHSHGSSSEICHCLSECVNPYPDKLIFLNFHPLKAVSRYRIQNLKCLEITHICLI